MFTLTLSADANFNLNYALDVPDGVTCRAHDVRVVVEAFLEMVKAQGTHRIPTTAEVMAERAFMAEWTPTADGVSAMNGVYSRMWTKPGLAEPVVAVCDATGNYTAGTVAALRALTE